MERLVGLLGILLILLAATGLSSARRKIPWRLVASGLAMEFVLAWLFLSFEPVSRPFDVLAAGITRIVSFADAGAAFIFGRVSDPGAGPWGFVFAARVLPTIVFFASFMAVLYHYGIMQRVVAALAWVLRRALGVSATEALSTAANIFVGQTEAPLCVRPYIAGMTRSQIMCIMTGGFASIAGSVMAAYIGFLGDAVGTHDARVLFAKHLLTASVMSAPGAIVISKIMVPETEPIPDEARVRDAEVRPTRNVVDAAAEGATDGLRLAFNVAAMLVAFVGLVALLNWPLAALSELSPIAAWRAEHGLGVFTFQNILGVVFRPVAWAIGVPWSDAGAVGGLQGQQVILTEFIAYTSLSDMVRDGQIGDRAAQIASYALCGFANLPSIAIQIGGLSAMAPERRSDFAALGLRAMTAGAFSCWMGAAIAGLFIP